MEIWVYSARKAGVFSVCVFSLLFLFPMPTWALPVSAFINEIHYDNVGGDVGEAVEIAGPAGLDLDGWQLLFYNGSSGKIYDNMALTGAIPDSGSAFGFVDLQVKGGMQNGSRDGLALIDALHNVIQFISYEGSLNAAEGAAAGLSSVDIGVSESNTTALGLSLQLVGTGTEYDDFQWAVGNSSFGAVNDRQRFLSQPDTRSVPTPGNLLLVAAGLTALLLVRRRQHSSHRPLSGTS